MRTDGAACGAAQGRRTADKLLAFGKAASVLGQDRRSQWSVCIVQQDRRGPLARQPDGNHIAQFPRSIALELADRFRCGLPPGFRVLLSPGRARLHGRDRRFRLINDPLVFIHKDGRQMAGPKIDTEKHNLP